MSDNNPQETGTVGQDQPVPHDHPGAPAEPQAQPSASSHGQEAIAEPAAAHASSSEGQGNDPVHNDQGPAAPQLHPELHEQGSGEATQEDRGIYPDNPAHDDHEAS